MNRDDMLARARRAAREPWDIVGHRRRRDRRGRRGRRGVARLQRAAARADDFGKGTSSRSTKLVHGGVRYLQQGNISLVMEALKERGLLRQNAPHLVTTCAFIVPELRVVGGAVLRHRPEGLRPARRQVRLRPFADPLAAKKRSSACRRSSEGLRGGVIYYDGQFDDARLLINLRADRRRAGRVAAELRARHRRSTKDADGFVDGVVARDVETGSEFTAARAVVINATGPFSTACAGSTIPARSR